MDCIPAIREFLLLANDLIRSKHSLNVSIFDQTKGTPNANTEGRTGRLNSKAAADIWEDKTAPAEDTFHINSCGYARASASKIKERRELTRDRKIVPSHA
jgi:hypothetical protein